MSDLGLAARTVLLAHDPDTGRRPDLQRLGPAVRAAGLAELVQQGLLEDLGDTVRSIAARPDGATAALLWEDCRSGPSWRRAVGHRARDFVHDAESELAAAGLAQQRRSGVGPFRRQSISPTATGRQEAAVLRARARDDAATDPGLAAIAVSLHTLGMRAVLDDGHRPDLDTLRETLPPGLVRAIERTALDRRVLLTS